MAATIIRGGVPVVRLSDTNVAVIVPTIDSIVTGNGELGNKIITDIKSAISTILENPEEIPVGGCVLASTNLVLDDNWHKCDGSTLDPKTYTDLATIIEPSVLGNLPNLKSVTHEAVYGTSLQCYATNGYALNANTTYSFTGKRTNSTYRTIGHLDIYYDSPFNITEIRSKKGTHFSNTASGAGELYAYDEDGKQVGGQSLSYAANYTSVTVDWKNVIRLRHTLNTVGTSLNYGNCDWQITPEPASKFIQLPDKPSPVDDFTYFMRVK